MATAKILLIEDVDHVGRKGDLATVKSGYAYNYLIPQKLALFADKAALRRQARLQEDRRLKAEQEKKEAEEMASKLQGEYVEIEMKVDHEGRMYGSVSVLDIVELVKLKTGIELEKKMVQVKYAIKEIGAFIIPLRMKEGITAEIELRIIPE
ncbi:MAG: 50S ribosomal protein L9 [Chlamydia sp.]